MSHEQTVLATLIVYQLALIALGLMTRERNRDGVDFFLGGRQLGPTVAAIAASASSSSAWTLLGVSGAAYSWGLSALWLFPACVGGFAINWMFIAPALRRASHETGAVTVTELIAGPVGRQGRQAIVVVASVIVLVSLGLYVAAQFQAAGKTFTETFGLSPVDSILIGAGVVLFYTMVGGFWAVAVTDALQGLMMATAAVIIPIAALMTVGGPFALAEGLRAVPVDGYLSLTRNMAWPAALGFILGLLGIAIGYPGQPHVVNKFMAMKPGDAALNHARRVGIGWGVLVYAGMLLAGLAGRVILPGLGDPEVVLISLANLLLPGVGAGLLIAAILSAIMSTADSQLLVAASAITYDLEIGRNRGSLLTRSRIVVLGLGLGAIGAALYGSQEIFSRVLFAWAAMGAAFGPLILIVITRGPVSARATVLAMVVGFASSVSAYYLPPHAWKGVFERIIPVLLALAIVYAAGRAVRPRNAG